MKANRSGGRAAHTFRGIPDHTIRLMEAIERRGISRASLIAAGIDALLIDMARQGKVGGTWKQLFLSADQQGKSFSRVLIASLPDSDDLPMSMEFTDKSARAAADLASPTLKRRPGRPRKLEVAS